MTKTWETKKKIVKIISKGPRTAMEISRELDLAPSTVSEHLETLEEMGAIQKKDNPFIKKWKYYELKNGLDSGRSEGMGILERIERIPKFAATFALVLGLIAVLALGFAHATAGNQVTFQLTDPPQVPPGTQALTISYSAIEAHLAGNSNASGWISGSGSGILNLMSLINTTQVIGTGKVPKNSTIDAVRFDITSANITINGTTYPVTVPSGELTTPVTNSSKVNSTSSVLIDLSPVVATIYTANSTDFVLVPSVKAIMTGGEKVPTRVGTRMDLRANDLMTLKNSESKISITAESLSVSGNVTTLSVSVKNNGNQSVTLGQLALMGKPSVTSEANPDAVPGNQIPMGPGAMTDHGAIARTIGKGRQGIVMQAMMFGSLDFAINANGTLSLPSSAMGLGMYKEAGYSLGAGATTTFTFSGPITLGRFDVSPIANDTYRVIIAGGRGAMARANMTATAN